MDGVFKFLDHYWKGAISGMTGILLSHPIDTIKTRIQIGSSPNIKSAIKMGKFYSGIKPPLLGIPLEKSIVFGFYNLAKENGLNNFFSGIIGGFMSTLIVTPVEYFKVNLQNKNVIDFTYREIVLEQLILSTFSTID